jgi:hypothetical protein
MAAHLFVGRQRDALLIGLDRKARFLGLFQQRAQARQRAGLVLLAGRRTEGVIGGGRRPIVVLLPGMDGRQLQPGRGAVVPGGDRLLVVGQRRAVVAGGKILVRLVQVLGLGGWILAAAELLLDVVDLLGRRIRNRLQAVGSGRGRKGEQRQDQEEGEPGAKI